MQAYSAYNDDVRYLLAVIDIFSKYGWLVPLKDKSGKSVAAAFGKKLTERKPKLVWLDKGLEFYNKDVKQLVDIYSTENEEKSALVKRWNRTMKERMFKYFSANSTKRNTNVLNALVQQYNNSHHSMIKMTPVEASLKVNENKVWRNLYPSIENRPIKPKFSIGDRVRGKWPYSIKATCRDGLKKCLLSQAINTQIHLHTKSKAKTARKYRARFTNKSCKRPVKKYSE